MVRGIEIKKLYKEGNGMRKLLSVLLIAMLGLSMFTACNPGSSTSEDLVSVKLMEGQSRALTATLDFDIKTQVKRWEYSAIKADGGLTTGQTETSGSKTAKVLGTNNETELLSQGYWNFDLYGYDAESDGRMICTGSVENVLVTLEDNSVTILVAPKQESTGTIVIKSDISILFDNGTSFNNACNVYTKVVEVSNATTGAVIESETALDSDIRIESASSNITYKVVVSFIGDYGKSTRYTAAKATKYINVYDNLTTTVSGSITESGTMTIIDAVAGSDSSSAEATIASSLFAADSDDNGKKKNSEPITVVAASGLSTSSSDTTVSVTESVITLPAGAVVKSSTATDNAGATLTLKSENLLSQASGSDTTTASEEKLAKYTISGLAGAPVATLEFGLEGASLDESLSKENSDKAPTGYIYIATNQGDSFDVVNGSDDASSTVKKTPTLNIGYLEGSSSIEAESDNQKPELLKYVKETGYLEYRVYHFSTYVIFSDKYVASDSNGNLYETIEEAAKKMKTGASIKLWKNIGDESNKSKTINLEGNNVTLDMGKNTIFGSINIGSSNSNDPTVDITIKGSDPEDYNVESEIQKFEDGGFTNFAAVQLWKPSLTIDGGLFVSDNIVLNVQVQGVYDSKGNSVGKADDDILTSLIVENGTFVIPDNEERKICVNQVSGKTVVNGGTFESKNGVIFKIEQGNSKQISKIVINNGKFTTKNLLIAFKGDKGDNVKIEIYGGEFKYGYKKENEKVISYLMEYMNGQKTIDNIPEDALVIYGGTFSTDPSKIIPDVEGWEDGKTINYVAEGYKAVFENEMYKVVENSSGT